jgi:beta-galactosidase
MRSYHILLIVILAFLYVQCNGASLRDSDTVLLNGSWDFKYISGSEIPAPDKNFFKVDFKGENWGKIDVPSNWELQGKAEPNYAGRLAEGVGLYRTTFHVPDKLIGKKIFIRFNGVLFAYELFVNGEFVGKWASAFNSKQFDISPYIDRDNTNLLAVKVVTHTQRGTHQFDISDCWSLSGIFRDVVLVSIPNIHLQDVEFRTKILTENSVKMSIYSTIQAYENVDFEKLTVEGSLCDSSGEKVYSFTHPIELSEQGQGVLEVKDVLNNRKLWSSENPNLYRLNLALYNDKKLIHSLNKKVGIREVKIENGILRLNNTPIKLRGVCMHEIHPERGRALTDEDRIKDLTMAKKANINFIRTSHYPHNQRFFEMCDSMGFYVMCEVPFNFGPKGYSRNLDYLPDLITRAEATVDNHKNHPCIITWSIGNENRHAEIYKKVAEYVAEKDPTRPRCFPQAPNIFAKEWEITPDIFNILAPHYLLPSQLDSIAKKAERPIVMTEYAHSLGLSTENMEENWEIVRKHPNIAGAAIWMWSDQGIKRNGYFEELNSSEKHDEIWIDSTTYYDGHHVYGNDGIVYSNRYPQVDYYLARKVYSPIRVHKKEIKIKPGQQVLEVEVENSFDFTSLDGFTCEWKLRSWGSILQQGNIGLAAPPKTTSIVKIPVDIPATGAGEFILVLSFVDPSGHTRYEKNISLLSKALSYVELSSAAQSIHIEITEDVGKSKLELSSEKTLFSVEKNGEIRFFNRQAGDTLLIGSPVIRVGRKPTLTLAYQGQRYDSAFFWDPYLLAHPQLLSMEMKHRQEAKRIVAIYRWEHPKRSKQYIEGKVSFTMLSDGNIHCAYDVKPYNATGVFMEFGLGFLLPQHYSTFRWLGEGPYVSVPGKRAYNERGVWALNKDDIRFNGNRTETDIAAFYHDKRPGIGLAFVSNKSDFGVEQLDERIMFTHNALVSGFGTKVNFTKYPVNADEVKAVQGGFKIAIIGKDSEIVNQVFLPLKEIHVEKPFFKSYGF